MLGLGLGLLRPRLPIGAALEVAPLRAERIHAVTWVGVGIGCRFGCGCECECEAKGEDEGEAEAEGHQGASPSKRAAMARR